MRRLALTLVAAAALVGGASLATAQTTTTTVVTQTATPTYYSSYYRVPYYRTAPSYAEMNQILLAAGYTNPTDLAINGDVWTGTAVMENHPVKIRFDRQGIWQLTK